MWRSVVFHLWNLWISQRGPCLPQHLNQPVTILFLKFVLMNLFTDFQFGTVSSALQTIRFSTWFPGLRSRIYQLCTVRLINMVEGPGCKLKGEKIKGRIIYKTVRHVSGIASQVNKTYFSLTLGDKRQSFNNYLSFFFAPQIKWLTIAHALRTFYSQFQAPVVYRSALYMLHYHT